MKIIQQYQTCYSIIITFHHTSVNQSFSIKNSFSSLLLYPLPFLNPIPLLAIPSNLTYNGYILRKRGTIPMGIYLVDYENVHNDGVTDIKKLSASDRVVIFYGDSIKSIPFETHVEMMASKAVIEYIETHKVAKNYLDFQLATYLGFLIGKGEKGPVYIISQDTGFDSIVDFWRGRNIEAFRQPSIASPSTPKDVSLKKGTSTKKKKKKSDHVPKESKKETKEVKETKEIVEKKKPEKKKLPEAIRKKIRTELKDEKLPAGKYTSIYKAVEESENKLALNNALVKTFDTTIGSKIYNHIKKIYEDYQR